MTYNVNYPKYISIVNKPQIIVILGKGLLTGTGAIAREAWLGIFSGCLQKNLTPFFSFQS